MPCTIPFLPNTTPDGLFNLDVMQKELSLMNLHPTIESYSYGFVNAMLHE